MPGRPTLYTPEIAERILAELCNGRVLCDICEDDGMPADTTVTSWVAADRDGFKARYRQAREAGFGRIGLIPYSTDVAERVLDELSSGRPLTVLCKDVDMPNPATVRRWVAADRDGFAARYQRAREIGYHAVADQILRIVDDRGEDWIVRDKLDGTHVEILDTERVHRARLRYEARRWLLSRLLPRVFGDRLDVTTRHDNDRDFALVLKAVDGTTRGLPRDHEFQ